MPLVWKCQMERRRERKNLPSFCRDRGLCVLLRGGKEHLLLTCSALPSEVSAPAGGEAGWAAQERDEREPWIPEGMCCRCRAHPALGGWHPGHRGRTAGVEPPSPNPALSAALGGELPADTQGHTSQLSYSSPVPGAPPRLGTCTSSTGGQKEFEAAQAPQSCPGVALPARLSPTGLFHPDGASHRLQGARDVLHARCSWNTSWCS